MSDEIETPDEAETLPVDDAPSTSPDGGDDREEAEDMGDDEADAEVEGDEPE